MNPKATAMKAAQEAGDILLSNFRKNIAIRSKTTSQNLVTKVDIAAEKKIVSIIKRNFPTHSFLTEEKTTKEIESDYIWIIDPIDGTNNYAHGLPHCSVSIALYKNNQPVLGVVYDPFRNELFFAQKNKGAFLNGKRIFVSKAKTLDKSLLVTGFYYERNQLMTRTLGHMEIFFKKNVHGIRRLGSAALDLCYVACGRFDGYWELKLSPWDFAAGALIVQESGGRVTSSKGNSYGLNMPDILASNNKIHDAMLTVVSK